MPLLIILVLPSSKVPAQNVPQKNVINCDSSIVNNITEVIITNLDTIKTEYYKINAFKDYPFQTASLFILSGVMLNDWQITNIQNRLGIKLSPNDSAADLDSLQIPLYKNRIKKIGKYNFGIYGAYTDNINFITISKNQMEKVFQNPFNDSVSTVKEKLLNELIRYASEEDFFLSDKKVAGFNELGLMQREIVSIPMLTLDDYNSLYNVASIITDDLAGLLNKEKNKKALVNYNELIAAVTNKLIEFGYIKIPAPRNFNYIITE
ncbi:MAG: hypothetical protein U5K00_23700 [Melioribacteraceae bacterium]|nr:hypothetical protein [Melioribacteraceae bacterium]